MKIAVLGGTGAMGSIYGGRLSLNNEVYLVGRRQELADKINTDGLILQENGEDVIYHPHAVTSTEELGHMDLIILFVKALASKQALEENKGLIGPDTYLMTLQNGSGHERILGEFAPLNRIIIGTTEDNGTVLGPGHIFHGGKGGTNIGMLCPDETGFLNKLKNELDTCGFCGRIHENILQLIWNKLFVNVSLSAVTGVLRCPMGYVAENKNAWNLCCALLHEAVMTAKALGLEADEDALREKVHDTAVGSPKGITSICADLRAGRRTEVDTISGSVVRSAEEIGVDVPTHRAVVNLVHAMEQMPANE